MTALRGLETADTLARAAATVFSTLCRLQLAEFPWEEADRLKGALLAYHTWRQGPLGQADDDPLWQTRVCRDCGAEYARGHLHACPGRPRRGCGDFTQWLHGVPRATAACYFRWRIGATDHTCVHRGVFDDGHAPMVHKCACGEERAA